MAIQRADTYRPRYGTNERRSNNRSSRGQRPQHRQPSPLFLGRYRIESPSSRGTSNSPARSETYSNRGWPLYPSDRRRQDGGRVSPARYQPRSRSRSRSPPGARNARSERGEESEGSQRRQQGVGRVSRSRSPPVRRSAYSHRGRASPSPEGRQQGRGYRSRSRTPFAEYRQQLWGGARELERRKERREQREREQEERRRDEYAAEEARLKGDLEKYLEQKKREKAEKGGH